jgi:hypothetical protein
MIGAAERKIDKYRRQFDQAATAMQTAVTAAGICAAATVAAAITGASEQTLHPEIRAQGIARQLLDGSGRLVLSVARSVLSEPIAPGAFDAATYAVGKLLAEAWRLRAGGDR